MFGRPTGMMLGVEEPSLARATFPSAGTDLGWSVNLDPLDAPIAADAARAWDEIVADEPAFEA